MLSTLEIVTLMTTSFSTKTLLIDGVTWNLDTMSTARAKVYVKTEGAVNVVYVMYRGTDKATDWFNNLHIPFQSYYRSRRYLDAEKVQNAAISKYKGSINTLSHSQGGKIVLGFIERELATGINITYNPAIFKHPGKNKLIIIAAKDDLLMRATRVKPDIIIESDGSSLLTVHKVNYLLRVAKSLPQLNYQTLANRKFPIHISAKTKRVCRRIGSAHY